MRNRFENTETPAKHRIPRLTAQPIFYLLTSIFLLSGCSSFKPLKGGRALSVPRHGGVTQMMAQSDNPSQISRQEQETIRTRIFSVPPADLRPPTSDLRP